MAMDIKLDCYSGYLIKSPCRECDLKSSLPECSNSCKTLERIHERLINVISCTNCISELELHSLSERNP
jgi:hypothetical protein